MKNLIWEVPHSEWRLSPAIHLSLPVQIGEVNVYGYVLFNKKREDFVLQPAD
jgi:hypothetical protein